MTNLLNVFLMCMGTTGQAAADGQQTTNGNFQWITMIIWIVVLGAFMYFFMIRPQKKEKQKRQDMMNSMAIGDTVLTTSGFYGTVIDMDEETVIVEFGNNKNCRIPMQRAAISAIEKPEDAQAAPAEEPKEKEKKGFFKKKEDKTEESK